MGLSKSRQTPFYEQLEQEIERLGGMYNAHLHLDRAGILDESYFDDYPMQVLNSSHISLQKKHHLINNLHNGPAYETEDLTRRVNQCLDVMVDCNTRIADSLVDVTADRVGLGALQTMIDIKKARASESNCGSAPTRRSVSTTTNPRAGKSSRKARSRLILSPHCPRPTNSPTTPAISVSRSIAAVRCASRSKPARCCTCIPTSVTRPGNREPSA